MKNECVQVVVRCRPMSKKEQASGEYKQIVDVFPSRGVVEIQQPNDTNRENRKMFTYDAVYDKQYAHNLPFIICHWIWHLTIFLLRL